MLGPAPASGGLEQRFLTPFLHVVFRSSASRVRRSICAFSQWRDSASTSSSAVAAQTPTCLVSANSGPASAIEVTATRATGAIRIKEELLAVERQAGTAIERRRVDWRTEIHGGGPGIRGRRARCHPD